MANADDKRVEFLTLFFFHQPPLVAVVAENGKQENLVTWYNFNIPPHSLLCEEHWCYVGQPTEHEGSWELHHKIRLHVPADAKPNLPKSYK